MIESFISVLENYQKYYRAREANKDVEKLITMAIPREISRKLSLSNDQYTTNGSVGMGNTTITPWISIFDKDITESAQQGFYIVFLFRGDMSGFYLSINQGTTYIGKKFKGRKPKNKMRSVATFLRENLDLPLSDFPLETIDLVSHTTNAKNYEAANICAKFYDLERGFSEEMIIDDISKALTGLADIKKFIGNRSLNKVLNDIIYEDQISDTKFQEDILISKSSTTPNEPQRPTEKTVGGVTKSKYIRNPAVAKEALENAEFTCQINKEHKTFESAVTGENFVEAHHLIPFNKQDNFEHSLDVPGNIIALCPNCHRCIHHGTKQEKKRILKTIYISRKNMLFNFGLHVDLDDIFSFYF
ncbi:DUF3578 domain-containing protein [Halobacillus fulvus]|nr:DUF3578 domain-containing protein [Halobacillus fulvus]